MPGSRTWPAVAIGVAYGVACGLLGTALEGTAGIVAMVGCLILGLAALLWVRMRWGIPRDIRKVLQSRLDPGAGPGASAQPVSLPLAERYVEAVNGRDWDGLRTLMGDRFAARSPLRPKPLNASGYLRAHRLSRFMFPDLRYTLEAVLQEGAQTWVRLSQRGRSRSGQPIETTWWERWTLDPEQVRLLAVEDAGIVHFEM